MIIYFDRDPGDEINEALPHHTCQYPSASDVVRGLLSEGTSFRDYFQGTIIIGLLKGLLSGVYYHGLL